MATGRYVTDLDQGDVLGPVEYTMSKFVVREYCHANELHQACFQNDATDRAADARPPRQAAAVQASPAPPARARPRASTTSTTRRSTRRFRSDVPLRVKGTVTERYEKKGRAVRRDADRPRHCGAADDEPPAGHVSRHVILAHGCTSRGRRRQAQPKPADRATSEREFVASGSPVPPRRRGSMTRERMRWYVDIQETVQEDTGRIVTQPPTIHDDDAYAKKQGLPGIIADGMISTNWILSLLVDVFGPEAASKGRLRTKYIAPIYEDQVVIACAQGPRRVDDDDAGDTVYELEVWCEDDNGQEAHRRRSGRPFAAALGRRSDHVERSFRRPRARPVARVRGPGGDADPRRPRRGRDQGRGAGPRRRGAPLRHHARTCWSGTRACSPSFLALNRNKRSIAIDLASPAGRRAVLRMVEGLRRRRAQLPARRDEEVRARATTTCARCVPTSSSASSTSYGQTGPLVAHRRQRPRAAGAQRPHEHHRRGRTGRRCAAARRSSTCTRASRS